MIWDEQVYMSYDTVLLVLASTNYNRKDYIESWSGYLREQGLWIMITRIDRPFPHISIDNFIPSESFCLLYTSDDADE